MHTDTYVGAIKHMQYYTCYHYRIWSTGGKILTLTMNIHTIKRAGNCDGRTLGRSAKLDWWEYQQSLNLVAKSTTQSLTCTYICSYHCRLLIITDNYDGSIVHVLPTGTLPALGDSLGSYDKYERFCHFWTATCTLSSKFMTFLNYIQSSQVTHTCTIRKGTTV